MRRSRTFFPEEDAEGEPIINLTPLIDVVFVVLISFMIIAPMLDVDRVDLATKGPNKSSAATSSPFSIAVRADNTIWIGNKQVSLSDLEERCRQEKSLHPSAVPQLIQDRKSAFGTYQTVKNTLESCGFEELELLLRPN
jgi:biopolymer transport protein ExbD